MCDAIYIGNTHHKLKKIIYGRLCYLLRLIKKGQKPDSFATHFEQQFNDTMSRKDICKYVMFNMFSC